MTPEDADYRVMAAQEYQTQREAKRFTSQLQADYGRWLITTIAAIHVAGIYLISSLPDLDLAAKRTGIWVLVAGLVMILMSGLAAWINWGAAAQLCSRRSDVRMLVDREAWPETDAEAKKMMWRIRAALRCSVILGLISVLCIPFANIFI